MTDFDEMEFDPTNEEYLAGYAAGQRNARRDKGDENWESKPANATAQ